MPGPVILLVVLCLALLVVNVLLWLRVHRHEKVFDRIDALRSRGVNRG